MGENVRDETSIILYKRCHIVFMPSWLLILQDVLSGWNTRFRYHLLFEQPSTICGGG